MKHFIIILTAFAFVIFGCQGPAGDHINKPNNTVRIKFPVSAKNKKISITEEDTLTASVGQINFTITPNGKLTWSSDPGDTLRLMTAVYISGAYLYLADDNLFIFYTETDYEGATSRLEKIDLKTKQSLWQTEIDGFNLGLPYIIDNYVYVSTIGFVGKIQLTTGKYVFECHGLYDHEKYSFNSFDTIIFRDSLTFFLAYNRNGNRTDTVIVDEKTGNCSIKK